MEVTDNLPNGGTESAADLTDIDNPENLNFFEPEEDNEEELQVEGNESESEEEQSSESENELEAQEQENEDTPEEEVEEPDNLPSDELEVELSNGEKVSFGELKSGYFRQSDYSRKSLANKQFEQALTAKASKIDNTIQVFTDFISSHIPNEPDAVLASTNPQEYMSQKAQYDAAVAQVQKLLEMGSDVKNANDELSQEERNSRVQAESAALASLFPQVTSSQGKEAFFKDVFKAAGQLGFSQDEMSAELDHRLIGLAYWANKGMEADKAKATVKEKVKNVPPVTAPKKRAVGKGGNQNVKAMQKLTKSGSIHDAVHVDWD